MSDGIGGKTAFDQCIYPQASQRPVDQRGTIGGQVRRDAGPLVSVAVVFGWGPLFILVRSYAGTVPVFHLVLCVIFSPPPEQELHPFSSHFNCICCDREKKSKRLVYVSQPRPRS